MEIYSDLARQAVEQYVRQKKILTTPDNLPKELYNQRAGVFVTLYQEKELRGCVGTYRPTKKNIAEEIITSAVVAAEDRRFDPVGEKELAAISYEVSVLSEPTKATFPADFNPQVYGMLVFSVTGKAGLLLPAIPGVNSPEKQLAITCQKGGIDPKKDRLELFRFTVKKYASRLNN